MAAWSTAAPVAAAAPASQSLLADGGRSDYRIVIASQAAPATRYAAEELQSFLARMTGARLPICSDSEPAQEREIVVGRSPRLESLSPAIDFATLGQEGYVLRTVGTRLLIAGGEPRGTLYGVYGLLEDHLGCRWFTPEVERIPRTEQLSLPQLDERQVPVFEYRETYLWESFDGRWMARNRLNGDGGRGRLADRWGVHPDVPRLEASQGGGIHFGSGFFVHTLEALVPAQKYFASHPEYYALWKGQRNAQQICCTHPEVARICTEGILTAMRQQPEARVFSLSQNDNDIYCQCEACQTLTKAEESRGAAILQLVNHVAQAAEKEFPDRLLETLAYVWSRQVPKTLRARPNVVIRLCNIECCFAHPLEKQCMPENAAFLRDLRAWTKACDRLWVWDYATDFSDYLLPFPQRSVLADNLRFYASHHVAGVFEQGTYDTPDGELTALNAYLMAKLLWAPQRDEKAIVQEFLDAYYGPAGPSIRQYLDLLQARVTEKNIHVRIYVPATHPHLTPELLAQADALWETAEAGVSQQAEVLGRVQRSRMSVDYAIVENARVAARTAEKDRRAEQQALLALAQRRFHPFMATLARSPLTRLREQQNVDKAAYRTKLAADLGLSLESR